MRFMFPKKRGWHKWFAWHPIYVWDTDEWVWFTNIYRCWINNFDNDDDSYGFWDYSDRISEEKPMVTRQVQRNRHEFSPVFDPKP